MKREVFYVGQKNEGKVEKSSDAIGLHGACLFGLRKNR